MGVLRGSLGLLVLLSLSGCYGVAKVGMGVAKEAQRSDGSGRSSGVSADTKECIANVKNLGVALEMYASDNQGRYPSKLSKLVPDHLAAIPLCAAAKADTYSDSYRRTKGTQSSSGTYEFCCKGEFHVEDGYPKDQPAYDSTNGLTSRPAP